MAYQGLPFAGASVKVDDTVIALITGSENNVNIDEVEVTGAEDVSGTAPNQISQKVYRPVGVDETVTLNGVYKTADAGQLDLAEAARLGKEIEIEDIKQDGYGAIYEGFLTGFAVTGALAGVYTFTANFRSNETTLVEPAS